MTSITLAFVEDILPLGPTQEETTDLLHGYMSDWPTTPFECEVPMHERWNCLKAIVSSKSIKLVTYNATVSLLPLYSYLMHENSKRDNRSFNESVAYLSGKSVYDGDQCFQTVAADECLHSIWDLRLVLWVSCCGCISVYPLFGCLTTSFYLVASTACFGSTYVWL